MIQLVVDNSECKLFNYDLNTYNALKKLLSYRDTTNCFKRRVDGKLRFFYKTKYLINAKAWFPTGLLYLVEGYLKDNKIPYELKDLRKKPELNKYPSMISKFKFEPYAEQVEAAKIAREETRGIICAPTGVGKSAICALIIDALKVSTLIVTPSLELKKQLTEGLQDAFGKALVGPMGKGNKAMYLITVENVDALDPKIEAKGFDCVIVDEFHHSGAATYRELNKKAWKNIYYKYGLTATPFRSRDEEALLLESVLSKVIYKIDYQTAVDKGYIVPMEVYVIKLPELKGKDKIRSYHTGYKELIVQREDRNELIVKIMSNLIDEGKSTLVLTKQIEHGVILQEMLQESGYTIPFVKGENDDNKGVITSFNSLDEKVIIGTTGVIGEGIDTKPAEYILIAGGGKSKNAFMQNLGRGFRKYPGKESCKVFIFFEPSHKWFKEHHKKCLKYLKEEYGIVPANLDMADII